MIIDDDLRDNLLDLVQDIDLILDNPSLTNLQTEKFLRHFEKYRYNILKSISKYNKNTEFERLKVKTIDDNYLAKVENDILKIYVPEVMPSYKNLKTHTYKRILLNVKEATKPFANLFKDEIFIYIEVFDNIHGWDIDNKCIKPIADALVASNVIVDDNINNMFYCVKGEFSDTPHTEIFVSKSEKFKEFIEKNLKRKCIKFDDF